MHVLEKHLKHKLLTRAEERELVERAKAGDLKASHSLVEHNLKLVYAIAKRRYPRWGHFWDIFQEGIIGLIQAIQTYEPSKGMSFASYAQWRIRTEMGHYVNCKLHDVYLPDNAFKENDFTYSSTRDDLQHVDERDPLAVKGEHLRIVATVTAPLNDIERRVVEATYLGDEAMSLREVGAKFRQSHERIRQIRTNAIRKMQGRARSKKITKSCVEYFD